MNPEKKNPIGSKENIIIKSVHRYYCVFLLTVPLLNQNGDMKVHLIFIKRLRSF